MKGSFQIPQLEKKIALFSAWMVTTIGFLILIEWLFKIHFIAGYPLFDFTLGYYPVMVIFLLGLSFLSLIYQKKYKLYKVLIFPVFIFSLQRLLGKYQQMLPISEAMTLLAYSIIFFFWPKEENRSGKVSAIFNFIIFLIILFSIEGCAIYILSLNFKDFIIQTPIDPLFAIYSIILGIGLICWNFYLDFLLKIKMMKWFPVFFGSGIILFHFFLIIGITQQEKLSREKILKAKAESVEILFKGKFVNLDHALNKLSVKIQESKRFDLPVLKIDAEHYLEERNFLMGILFVDANFSIKNSFSKNDLNSIKQRFLEIPKENFKTATNLSIVGHFNSINKRIYLFKSLFWNGNFQGGIVFEVDIPKFLEDLQFSEIADGEYNTELICEQTVIYPLQVQYESEKIPPDYYKISFSIYNLNFGIQIEASKNLLFSKIINRMVMIIAIVGIVGGVLTGVIIYLFQVLKEKMAFSQKILKQITMSDALMKVMNESESIDEACDKILKILYEKYDWNLFLYWQLNSKNQLELAKFATIPLGTYTLFEKEVRNLKSFQNTLFQKAFEERDFIYIEDFSKTNFELANMAKHEGIKGAFASPVVQKRKILGVIELFRNTTFEIEPEVGWFELMKTIGNQFSFFIERREAHLLDKELTGVIENTSDAIYKVDLDLIIKSWNLGAELIFGWKSEEIIGKDLRSIYPQDQLDELMNIYNHLTQKKIVEHFKTKIKRKDGKLIWVENTYSPILGENKKISSFSVITRDIDIEKRAADKIKKSEEKLNLFVNTTKSWIWETDLNGNFTYSNQTTSYLIGYDHKEIEGKNFLSFALEKEKIQKEFLEAVKNQTGWKQRIWRVQAKNGSLLWLESTADPIVDQDKNFIGFRGVDRDVTAEININTTKNEFISMVSHELRTPLTSIIGALGLIKVNEGIPLEVKELINVAERNSGRLLKLINDILDLEKLNLGKLKLNLKPYELLMIVNEAINVAKIQAEENKISIEEKFPIEKVLVNVDYERTLQVLLNLLTNAIKFSKPNSKIIIYAELKDQLVRINIQDSGQGIPYDMQGKIFDKFIQGKTGDTKVKGTGLGLYICKGLIEQMGGKIGFSSEPDKGSIFFFDLPILNKKG